MATPPSAPDDERDQFFDTVSEIGSTTSLPPTNIPPGDQTDAPFLVQSDTTQPASVAAGTWTRILQDRQLTLATDTQIKADDLLTVDEESGEAIVYLTWAPKSATGTTPLLQHDFSSERNFTYFGGPPSTDLDLKNTANVGDGFQSGVMLRRPSPDTSLFLWTAILPAFGIDTTSHPMLMKLFAVLDSAQALTAHPTPAPDWAYIFTPTVFGTTVREVQHLAQPVTFAQGTDVFARKPTDAIWCVSQDGLHSVVTSVTYSLTLNLSNLMMWVKSNFGNLAPSSWANSTGTSWTAYLTLTQTAVYNSDTLAVTTGPIGTYSTVADLAFDLTNLFLYLHFDGSAIQALLVPSGGSGSIYGLINGALAAGNGLSDHLGMLPGNPVSNLFANLLKDVYLWHVSIGRSLDISQDSTDTSLFWNFALYVAIPMGSNQNAIVTLIYDSQTKTFTGRFVTKQTLIASTLVRAATWDPRIDLIASLKAQSLFDGMVNEIDLLQIIGLNNNDCPVPLTLLDAGLSYTRASSTGSSLLSLWGSLGHPTPPSGSTGPPMPFRWNSARVDADIIKDATTTTFDITLLNTFILTGSAPSGEVAPSVAFSTLLRYQNPNHVSNLTFTASASSFTVAAIELLFDEDSKQGVMGVLGNITVATVEIDYQFTQKQASKLSLTGILVLGELELDLMYKYPPETSTDAKWTFSATLRANSSSSTIASVAESIVPGAADSLPDFVGSIPVSPQGNAPIFLFEMTSKGTKSTGTTTILTVWLTIGGLSLTFIRYRTQAASATQGNVKSILRISVDQIPMMDKIPIVGQLPQPFDHLIYMWVEDDRSKITGSTAPDPTTLGFTKGELADLQASMPSTIPPLQVKASAPPSSGSAPPTDATKKSPSTSKGSEPADIAIARGHHFVVVVHGQVVLDHVFNTSKADSKDSSDSESAGGSTNKTSTKSTSGTSGAGSDSTTASQIENKPTKGDTTTTAGPLSISALTLQYKKGHLIVSVDATLKLGPLTFSVIGFALDVNLSGVKLDHLADIVTQGLISASLHGMEVGVAQGPLTLKGVFIHDKTAAGESYRGGIAVGFKAWQVLAIGEYFVHLDSKGNEDYKAVFVYGKVDGPLIELEFATISGVRVGFGYNYGIRMPGLQELTKFPLISDSGISGNGNDPGAVLEAFRGGDDPFVFVRKGSAWFAVGMTITAFDLLTLTAVLVLDIDDGESDPNEKGVIIAMFADGIFQMEPLVSPDLALLYIELVIGVELNFVHDYIAANAALAPASHLLVPECHLAGQAAFYTWFGNNPHAGDWVASIGGYPRAYRPQPWYPVPNRITLSFTVGDMIHLVGTAYCAVTPKCAMAGGTLHLSLDVGPVSAYADLIFDAFINFQPFHFRASMSISVGVSCTIDLGLISIHISISLGADLIIWGPHDFGGRAHVDFWFFGFNINFGAIEDPKAKDPVDLPTFLAMVNKPGPVGDNNHPPDDTVGATGGTTTLHKYSVEDGMSPQTVPPPGKDNSYPSTGALSEWHVLAGSLKIRIDCGFALSGATMTRVDEKTGDLIDDPILLPDKTTAPDVYSWPMHSTDKLTSTVKITVSKVNAPHEIVSNFKAELVLKPASTALWTKWDPNLDPLHSTNGSAADHLNDPSNGTVPLVQAVRLIPPDPERARSKIIDFDATAAMKFTIPNSPSFPTLEVQSDALRPAYFESVDDKGQPLDGVKRWSDFEDVWLGNEDATIPEEDVRKELATLVADMFEWQIRPPQQMAKNDPSTLNTTGAGTTSRASVANAAKVNDDGRREWELVPDAPIEMLALIGEYFPALPYVCA